MKRLLLALIISTSISFAEASPNVSCAKFLQKSADWITDADYLELSNYLNTEKETIVENINKATETRGFPPAKTLNKIGITYVAEPSVTSKQLESVEKFISSFQSGLLNRLNNPEPIFIIVSKEGGFNAGPNFVNASLIVKYEDDEMRIPFSQIKLYFSHELGHVYFIESLRNKHKDLDLANLSIEHTILQQTGLITESLPEDKSILAKEMAINFINQYTMPYQELFADILGYLSASRPSQYNNSVKNMYDSISEGDSELVNYRLFGMRYFPYDYEFKMEEKSYENILENWILDDPTYPHAVFYPTRLYLFQSGILNSLKSKEKKQDFIKIILETMTEELAMKYTSGKYRTLNNIKDIKDAQQEVIKMNKDLIRTLKIKLAKF